MFCVHTSRARKFVRVPLSQLLLGRHPQMALFVTAFLSSLLCALGLISSFGRHRHLSADATSGGPQKYHVRPVPRIGGVSLFFGTFVAAILGLLNATSSVSLLLWLMLASAPAFGSGLIEDLTKAVTPRIRLACAAVAAGCGIWLLDARLIHTGLPWADAALAFAPLSIAITLFAVAGIANAINIIDGVNGLASVCALTMLAATAYVAFQVGDTSIVFAALILCAALLGFVFWNYPHGLMFLGDGGAYFLGFMVAELNLLLAMRHPEVSPMFALLLCIYPVFETLFTIARRVLRVGRRSSKLSSAFMPDSLHLHSLIHRRLVRSSYFAVGERRSTMRNAMTAPYLWALCLLSVLPCVLWWNDTAVLVQFAVAFVVAYLALYRAIVRFKTPSWLSMNHHAKGPAAPSAFAQQK
jgi:UDP-N-acetylmuramyl pentapeptide phosphotransferase/UDP-N-acetylglucosamine-1-phosphate transferase